MQTTPIPDLSEGMLATISLRGRALPSLAMLYMSKEPEKRIAVRYLPERSETSTGLGDDDYLVTELRDLPGGGTRILYTRELTHRTPSTRITVPLGLRQGLFMLKDQLELEAGVAPVKPSPASQLAWTLVAFASFGWLVGLRDALLLMLVILIHEAGHALAMIRYGLGVHFVGFVPFLGGIAIPKRYYESEWQKSVVLVMGVGLSLPVALYLLWLAHDTGEDLYIDAAALFAIINGTNLLPLPGLDGGQLSALLSRKIHRDLGRILMWSMFAVFVALAVYLGSPLMWVAIAFAFVHVSVTSSIDFDSNLKPMTRATAMLVFASYLGLIAAYGYATYSALQL